MINDQIRKCVFDIIHDLFKINRKFLDLKELLLCSEDKDITRQYVSVCSANNNLDDLIYKFNNLSICETEIKELPNTADCL